MSTGLNPIAWLGWAGAVTLVIVSTRNPLYLVLAGAAVLTVYLSLERRAVAHAAWRTVLRIGIAVAILSVTFNLLTVHAGDRVIGRLPGALPIIGGPITLNALVYGVSSALAILTLLLVAATFSAAVDRAALLRLVPAQFAAAGVAAIVALSIFPQTLRAAVTVREAQAARGFRVRSVRDLPPLVVPILHLGLEHAFDLAEAMESRAFGTGIQSVPISRPLLGVALGGATGATVALAFGHRALGTSLAVATVLALIAWSMRSRRVPRERYRLTVWTGADGVVLAASLLAGALIVTTLATSNALSFTPYPRLAWPGFALAPGLACLLLAAPAPLGSGRGRR